MRVLGSISAIGVAGFVLASCQSTSTPTQSLQPNAEAPKEQTTATASSTKPADKVAGRWVPTDPNSRKIYYNEFKAGKFGAYSVDGKNTLAVGSYSPSDNGVAFQYFSQTRKRQVKANCTLSSPSRMTCRVDDGSVVELQRA